LPLCVEIPLVFRQNVRQFREGGLRSHIGTGDDSSFQQRCPSFVNGLNGAVAALRRIDNQNALLGSSTQFIDEI
jgi:hypothetical protein